MVFLFFTVFVTSSFLARAADLGTAEHDHPTATRVPDPMLADPTHPFFRHRLMLQAGAAFNKIDSSASVGTESGTRGTRLSFEDDLGLASSKTAFDALIRYRVSNRWMIEGEYFDLPRNSSASTSGTIQFGRLSFPASAAVSADFDIKSIRLAGGYAFHKSANAEVGAALSLYVTDFGAALSGRATLGGLAAGFQSEKYSEAAPLPTIGLYANYAITSRWLTSGRLDFTDFNLSSFKAFGYNLEDVNGQVLSLEASTEYRLTENVGVGIAYRYMDVSMGATSSGLKGDINYKVSAPVAFVRGSF